MKKLTVCILVIYTLLCGNVSAAEDMVLTGVINERYITDGIGNKVQCLVLTLDEEKVFDVYDDTGDKVHITTKEIQLSSKNYTSDMNGTRVTVKGNDLLQGISYYHIRPVVLLNAEIIPEKTAESNISVKVNGETILFDQPPILKNDRTFVPIRAITEKLGAKVSWDETSQCVTVSSDTGSIQLYIDYAAPYINGIKTVIDAKPFIENGRTMVPVRVIAQALGASVLWDNENNCVIIEHTPNISESKYSEYMNDTAKPMVFDSNENGSSETCKIPQLNLKNAASLNEKIISTLKPKIKYAYGISYTYSITNDIVSIASSVMSEEEFYYSFNFDIKTGEELTAVDLCKRLGMSETEYVNAVREKCVKAFDTMCPVSLIEASPENGGVNKEFYYNQRAAAGSEGCFSMSSQWFLSAGNTINVFVYLPGVAGGDYIHAIDTGITLSR